MNKEIVEANATIIGELFVGMTGHHHTKALVDVKSIVRESR
jgi:hypothetical protein